MGGYFTFTLGRWLVGKVDRWVCMLVGRLLDRKVCRCLLLGR